MDNFESVTGKGVRADYQKKKIGLGNHRLIEDFKATLDEEKNKIVAQWQSEGQTVIYVILEDKIEGIVSVTDKIKETSAAAIKAFQKMGIKVHMLTGDNQFTAEAVAGELVLDGFQSECLPEDKYNKIKELQSQGNTVAMAGDGINDAPALKQGQRGYCNGYRNRHSYEECRNNAGKRRFKRDCPCPLPEH